MDIQKKTPASKIAEHYADNIKGKVAIVTGSNSGVGLQTAKVLASHGIKVIVPCRTMEKAQGAVDEIKKAVPDADLVPMQLELDSLASIRAFVKSFLDLQLPLHLLINNAGVMACPLSYTKDGFEMQFGVNHLGHFLLTKLLSDKLKANPSRVINLTSSASYYFPPSEGIPFDNLDGKKSYNPWTAYGTAKLANILHAEELQRRFDAEGADVICVAVHPGNISTGLQRHIDVGSAFSMMKAASHWSNVFSEFGNAKNVDQGASTTILCASAPDIVKGEFYANNKIENLIRDQHLGDVDMAKKLWEVSETLVAEKGSNSGIGLQTATVLAAHGTTVIIPCRTTEKAQKAVETIKQKYPQADLIPMQLELDSLASVGAFVKSFIELDIPISSINQ